MSRRTSTWAIATAKPAKPVGPSGKLDLPIFLEVFGTIPSSYYNKTPRSIQILIQYNENTKQNAIPTTQRNVKKCHIQSSEMQSPLNMKRKTNKETGKRCYDLNIEFKFEVPDALESMPYLLSKSKQSPCRLSLKREKMREISATLITSPVLLPRQTKSKCRLTFRR
ncbi:hypothetical protein RUM43_008175 [Polyplax serrata]|uniref:Uncharacterized protein n=1 Tax=Polyplax serrata TaxID=468196 RepID=A0AAN8S5Z6_POLSC